MYVQFLLKIRQIRQIFKTLYILKLVLKMALFSTYPVVSQSRNKLEVHVTAYLKALVLNWKFFLKTWDAVSRSY